MKSKLIQFIAIVLPFFAILSCTDDDDNGNIIEGNNSVVDYLDKNPDYSIFRRAIDRAGLSSLLQGNSGSFTVFAPQNESFETYFQENSIDSIGDLSQEAVEQLVDYHILLTLNSSSSFSTSYLRTRSEVPVNDSTASRLSLLVEVDGPTIKLNETTQISEPDIQVDNGILHQIDHVLSLPTIETFLLADENLTPFYTQLTTDNSDIDFQNWISDPFEAKTLFVPNADAVDNFLDQGNGFSQNTLLNHFLDGMDVSTEFQRGYRQTLANKTLQGDQVNLDLYINNLTGLRLNDMATITIQDIVTVNGIIHVVNHVLTLPTLSDFIRADVQLNQFETALGFEVFSNENYFNLLGQNNSTNSPFTVFGPDDEAFDNLLIDLFPETDVSLEDIPVNQLKGILENNIISGNALVAPFENQSVTSINDETVMIDGFQVSGGEENTSAELISKNAQAINGILHKINPVLH